MRKWRWLWEDNPEWNCANIGCGDKIIQSTSTETWDNYDYNHPDQNVIPLDLNNPRFALKMQYDYILIDQVLEHVIHPFDVMNRLKTFLAKEGEIQIGLPLDCNCLSHLRSRHPQEYLQGLYKDHFGNNQYWDRDYDLIKIEYRIKKPLKIILWTWYKKVRYLWYSTFYTEVHTWVKKR